MTPVQGVLFTVVMVLVWFVCVSKLSRRLHDRHPEKYEQMRLADLWPRDLAGWFAGHNNAKPVFALLRFLSRREDLALHDADISSLSVFMRWFFYVYFGLFLVLVFLILSQNHQNRAIRARRYELSQGKLGGGTSRHCKSLRAGKVRSLRFGRTS